MIAKAVVVITALGFFGFAMLLGACATTGNYEKVLDTWRYAHADELVRAWGAPTSTYTMSDGGRVLMYDKRYTTTSSTPMKAELDQYNPGQIKVTGGQVSSTTHWCQTEFHTGSDGRIQRWRWKGNNCRARGPKEPKLLKANQCEVLFPGQGLTEVGRTGSSVSCQVKPNTT